MRETLNVQVAQKKVISDEHSDQPDGSYKDSNEIDRDITMDNETYLSQLLQDQCSLRTFAPGQFKYLQKILDKEIATVSLKITQEKTNTESVERTRNKITPLTEIIMVPVEEFPTYNFVGRILGPRGMTVRQLEEQTGCKIMVRGRGSIKGKIRDRGSEDEPLHVMIQCEDYPDRVKEKMKRAVDRVNEFLTPPPDGKDELKRKQLVELAIINGTYRPTNATKNALQTPSPFDAGHLTSRLDYPMLSPPCTNQLPDGDLLQKLQLLQLLSCNNPSITDYLLRSSMPGSPIFSSPFLSSVQSPSNNYGSIDGVHQASFLEYLDAAALVNSVPTFTHDGSGDCPKK